MQTKNEVCSRATTGHHHCMTAQWHDIDTEYNDSCETAKQLMAVLPAFYIITSFQGQNCKPWKILFIKSLDFQKEITFKSKFQPWCCKFVSISLTNKTRCFFTSSCHIHNIATQRSTSMSMLKWKTYEKLLFEIEKSMEN